jgi:acid phosphatase
MRGRRLLALAGAVAAALWGCGGGADTGSAIAPPSPVRGPAPFDRVMVVVFENKAPDEVLGDPAAPTFTRLAHRYALLSGYGGVAHPSLPNYLALVSGSTHGVKDCDDCTIGGPNLADLLERRGRTWKTYAEALPSRGYGGGNAGPYRKHHDPFVYFRSIRSSERRLQRVVPFSELAGDLDHRRLPDFSLVIPDNCHNMHDCPVSTGDTWLKGFLPGVLASPQMRHGVVFVIFDEGKGRDPGLPGGRIPALAVGPTVRPGSRTSGTLDHYALLRTIEDAFRLPRLGRSASARPITGIWR